MKRKIEIIKPVRPGYSKKVIVDGKMYHSLNSLPFTRERIYSYQRKTGCSEEEAIDHLLDMNEELLEKSKEKNEEKIPTADKSIKQPFIFRGIPYKSLASCVRAMEKEHEGFILDEKNVYAYARIHSITKQEALEIYLKNFEENPASSGHLKGKLK